MRERCYYNGHAPHLLNGRQIYPFIIHAIYGLLDIFYISSHIYLTWIIKMVYISNINFYLTKSHLWITSRKLPLADDFIEGRGCPLQVQNSYPHGITRWPNVLQVVLRKALTTLHLLPLALWGVRTLFQLLEAQTCFLVDHASKLVMKQFENKRRAKWHL